MPAVDTPEPGGLSLQQVTELVTPLARHPKALGLELTIYDPALDPERHGARRLVELLRRVCATPSISAGPVRRLGRSRTGRLGTIRQEGY